MSLHGLARVTIGVPDVDAVTGFYTDFGLTRPWGRPVRHLRRW